MAERNLYRIHFDLTVQNKRSHRKMTWDDKKTVVANGDATKAIKKLRRALMREPPTILEDKYSGGDKIRNVDVQIRSVELVSQVNYA